MARRPLVGTCGHSPTPCISIAEKTRIASFAIGTLFSAQDESRFTLSTSPCCLRCHRSLKTRKDYAKSTEDAIAHILHTALSCLDNRKGNYVRLLFIDYSSAFNTIVPSTLITELRILGLDTSLCWWVLDFLTGKPQVGRVGSHISSSITLNTGAPQRCIFIPLHHSLYTHDSGATFNSSSIVKCADDTAVVGLVSNGDEEAYLEEGSIVRPGFGFLRDGSSLAMLREMMVMIRIWGLLKPGCLPIYTATSDNQDSMSLLFRLLTKLWLCSRDEGHPQEPDETLVDECCLLPSQLLVPSLDWLPVNDGVICKLQGKHPLRLQFGKPYSLPWLNSNAPLEIFSRNPGAQKMDNLRCLHLGVCPTEESKACTRCGCVTMLRSPNKTNAMKQWEQRWIKNCLCGGLWRRIPPHVVLK
ncbi:mediator of RNA polymerase II transcription subunit 16-like [Aplochiton taeniatus]